MPTLDQRQRDILGLALMAAGIFLGLVLYGGWAGGRAGHGVAVGLGWVLGGARMLAPVALFAGGAALLLRPVIPAIRPLRTGSICLFAGVTLALAAGTLGISSGARIGNGAWSSVHLQSHGGIIGQALYEGSDRLVQSAGVAILVVFLLLTGLILITGASLAGVLRATGGAVADTTRLVRGLAERDADLAPASPRASRGMQPPEPESGELIVRATHVEAPPRDWEAEDSPEAEPEHEEQADLVADAEAEDAETAAADGESEQEEIAGVAHADPADLTPQGRLRGAITDDPDFVWQLPDASRLLTRSTSEQTRPDTAGQEKLAASLVEALGHFGVQAKVIGTISGPHITRYELRLAPGTKVGKVAQLKDDLAYALAATDIRILAPIPGK